MTETQQSIFSIGRSAEALADNVYLGSLTDSNRSKRRSDLERVFDTIIEDDGMPDRLSPSLTSLIKTAIEVGDVDRVKELVTQGVFDFGIVLYEAGKSGDRDLVEFLLYSPVISIFTALKPRTTKVYVNTALQGAAASGNMELVDYLLDKGADPKVGLSNAARYGDLNLVQFLFESMCQDDRNNEMITLLNSAAEGAPDGYYDTEEVLQFVLDSANFTGEVLSQALYFASKNPNRQILDRILEKANQFQTVYTSPLNPEDPPLSVGNPAGDANQMRDNMNWAIKGAATIGDVESVHQYLLYGGDDISNALIAAVRAQDRTSINQFVQDGADNWNDALAAAVATRDYDLILDFLPSGPHGRRITNYQPAMEAAIDSDENTDLYLLDTLGSYVEERNYVDILDNLLVRAIDKRSRPAMVYILAHLIEELDDSQYQNRLNDSLIYAAWEGKAEIVKYLLDLGAASNEDLRDSIRQVGFIDVSALL